MSEQQPPQEKATSEAAVPPAEPPLAAETAPTFEDLAIDDRLGDLERIQKYAHSNIALQRLVHVKMLAETAKAVGFQATVSTLLPILSTLVSDTEFVVRQHLAEQFAEMGRFFVESGGEQGYRLLINSLLPLLSTLVSDSQAAVRHAAGDGLVAVAELLHVEDQGQHILTTVLQLSHDDEQEDLRMAAVVLLNQLAKYLGPELCHQFVTPEIVSLSEDPVFRVRKATALNIHNVCIIAGPQDTTERLLPAFLRLTQDDIWGVRKACAESLCAVSQAVEEPLRIELVDVLRRFLGDASKWVRSAVFQQLGPFLSTLPAEQLTPELLAHYTATATATTAEGSGDATDDLKLFCAFSLPAVAQRLGAERWPELAPTWNTLTHDSQWQVRRTLAFSAHELARVLGRDLAEKELIEVFDRFLRDLDEVKIGAITHLGAFLSHLHPSCRERYLPIIKELRAGAGPTQWRLRQLIASQLAAMANLFSTELANAALVPLVLELLCDDVNEVRETSHSAVAVLINHLAGESGSSDKDDGTADVSAEGGGDGGGSDGSGDQEMLEQLIAKLTGHAVARSYQERQIYIRLCALLAREIKRPLFEAKFLAPFRELIVDAVPNVRLLALRVLHEAPDWFPAHELILPGVRSLSEDDDQDVDVREGAEKVLQRLENLHTGGSKGDDEGTADGTPARIGEDGGGAS